MRNSILTLIIFNLFVLLPGFAVERNAVDLTGPDGIVYPNWKGVGVDGGIPDIPVKAKLSDFGGIVNDGKDDAEAIKKAFAQLGKDGGGAIMLDAGNYLLSRPVVCTHDNVVLRGSGKEKTKIIFDYALPEKGVVFFQPAPNDTIHLDSWIEIHADPHGLNSLAIFVNDRRAAGREKHQHWGGTFSINCRGSSVLRLGKAGKQKLRAVAKFDDGTVADVEIPVIFSPDEQPAQLCRIPRYLGAITFAGERPSERKHLLAADAERGDTRLQLQNAGDLKKGDIIILEAPKTERWDREVNNACEWGTYRRNEYRITAVQGNTISIHEPLRIPFPAIDKSYVQRYQPIQRCGVENLFLEQTKELWTGGIIFSGAWNCWVKGVHVQKAGRWPAYPSPAKHCEIRDSSFDDAWYHGGGGTAYVGFEMAFDCLMDNVSTNRMRHAPCVQWAAAGNVIRNSTFIQSDGQWHSGWTHENLFENCILDAKQGTGSYGHGFWASPPEDKAHGPNGPRNVVWGCDVVAPKAGVWMGGMNSGWLILYNRIHCGAGPAIFMKTNSDEHIIANNVFILDDNNAAAFAIRTEDCDGVQIKNNEIYSTQNHSIAGNGKPEVYQDNRFFPDYEEKPAPPAKPVESIYEWQQ